MKNIKTVKEINQEYLCIGCGTCVSVCPSGAIKMICKRGQFFPEVDKSKCIRCGSCVAICPGISISLEKISRAIFPKSTKNNELIGRFESTHIGYSNKPGIRFKAASGGIATSLLIYLLKEKFIDGAIITRMKKDNPLVSESFIATSRKEIISAQTSKYCPTSPVSIAKNLKELKEKKFAFVGLPCQIHGVRKLQEKEKWAREKIKYVIGIFCGHGVTFSGISFITDRFAKGIKGLKTIDFRGRGWPGSIKIIYEDGDVFIIDHNKYWPSFFATYFFTPYRCLTCYDFSSELADISLGDAWLKEIMKKDNKGTSIIITRSKLGKKTITNMKKKKEIVLEEISLEKVLESQKGILVRKKKGVGPRIKFFKNISKPIPKYDQKFKADFRGHLGASLVFLNAFSSKFRCGRTILKLLSLRVLKRYRNFVYKLIGS